MIKPKIQIAFIGMGVVGDAVAHAYQGESFKTYFIDSNPARNSASYQDIAKTQAVFVCVPSPNDVDGRYDTSALTDVLNQLENYTGVIISKVTATPDVYRTLSQQYPNLVHCPEFLTAANPRQDYTNSKFMIVGGRVPAYMREAERIIRMGGHTNTQIHHCSIEEAAMAKMSINSYLATKVVFMNELQQLCQSFDIDYLTISRLMQQDQRIGSSHMRVPGPDGLYGFGGMCFPKDTTALLKFAEDRSIDFGVLESAVKKNTLLRIKN